MSSVYNTVESVLHPPLATPTSNMYLPVTVMQMERAEPGLTMSIGSNP